LAFNQRAHVLNKEHDAVNAGVLSVGFEFSLHDFILFCMAPNQEIHRLSNRKQSQCCLS
jgi:hypothetical protein